MNQEKLHHVIAGVYKKLENVSKELDIMVTSEKEKNSQRFVAFVDSYDKLTKRLVDLWMLEQGETDSDKGRMQNLAALVDWAHKYRAEQEESKKQQLLTIKHYGNGRRNKKVPLAMLTPREAREELEQLLRKKRLTLYKNFISLSTKKNATRGRRKEERGKQ